MTHRPCKGVLDQKAAPPPHSLLLLGVATCRPSKPPLPPSLLLLYPAINRPGRPPLYHFLPPPRAATRRPFRSPAFNKLSSRSSGASGEMGSYTDAGTPREGQGKEGRVLDARERTPEGAHDHLLDEQEWEGQLGAQGEGRCMPLGPLVGCAGASHPDMRAAPARLNATPSSCPPACHFKHVLRHAPPCPPMSGMPLLQACPPACPSFKHVLRHAPPSSCPPACLPQHSTRPHLACIADSLTSRTGTFEEEDVLQIVLLKVCAQRSAPLLSQEGTQSFGHRLI